MEKRIFKFNREVDDFDVWRWYVELPEWEGSKADLEMVAGADLLLEILRFGCPDFYMKVEICEEYFEDAEIILHRMDDKGNYLAEDLTIFYLDNKTLNVWLCEVTLFVYGYYPTQLYLKIL